MKTLLLVITFLFSNFKDFFQGPKQNITEQIILNIRAVALNVVLIIVSIALFCPSVYLFLTNLAARYDETSQLNWSATAIVAGMIATICLGVLIYCFKKSTWVKSAGLQKPTHKQVSPIENAIALLIMDFVKSREEKRDHSTE